jgi:hypothetical protein
MIMEMKKSPNTLSAKGEVRRSMVSFILRPKP